jgi:hypothetical protein
VPGAPQRRHGRPDDAPVPQADLCRCIHKATVWPGTDTGPRSRAATPADAGGLAAAKLMRECAKWLNALTRLVSVADRANRLAAV